MGRCSSQVFWPSNQPWRRARPYLSTVARSAAPGIAGRRAQQLL
jgi:hypothetical protein